MIGYHVYRFVAEEIRKAGVLSYHFREETDQAYGVVGLDEDDFAFLYGSEVFVEEFRLCQGLSEYLRFRYNQIMDEDSLSQQGFLQFRQERFFAFRGQIRYRRSIALDCFSQIDRASRRSHEVGLQFGGSSLGKRSEVLVSHFPFHELSVTDQGELY